MISSLECYAVRHWILPEPQNYCPIKCSKTWCHDEWFGGDLTFDPKDYQNVSNKCRCNINKLFKITKRVIQLITIFMEICKTPSWSYCNSQSRLPIHDNFTLFSCRNKSSCNLKKLVVKRMPEQLCFLVETKLQQRHHIKSRFFLEGFK